MEHGEDIISDSTIQSIWTKINKSDSNYVVVIGLKTIDLQYTSSASKISDKIRSHNTKQ